MLLTGQRSNHSLPFSEVQATSTSSPLRQRCSPTHPTDGSLARTGCPASSSDSIAGAVPSEPSKDNPPKWMPCGRDLRLLLENGSHPRHPNCPDSLTCLEDSLEEPTYTVPVMIRCAILSAYGQKLSTHQICQALKTKYSYFRSRDAERKLNVSYAISASTPGNSSPKAYRRMFARICPNARCS